MKIQSVQNQQMQSRPNFSANGRLVPHVPDVYSGTGLIKESEFQLMNDQTDRLLQKLFASLKKIVSMVDEEANRRFGNNNTNFVRSFRLNDESGAETIILSGQPKSNSPSIYWQHSDGGETQIHRECRNGSLTGEPVLDPEFDKVAEALGGIASRSRIR